MRFPLFLATALALALAGRADAAPTTPTPAPTLADAHRAYYEGRYRQALLLFEQLAGQGDAEAAERAGFMRVQADGLYGREVPRDLDRARRLLLQAAHAGRPAAGVMLNMLEGAD